jgi:hypothetical protein
VNASYVIWGALCPSKSGLMNKHTVKHTVTLVNSPGTPIHTGDDVTSVLVRLLGECRYTTVGWLVGRLIVQATRSEARWSERQDHRTGRGTGTGYTFYLTVAVPYQLDCSLGLPVTDFIYISFCSLQGNVPSRCPLTCTIRCSLR